MIVLANTTDELRLVTSAAVALDVHCSFVNTNATDSEPDRQNTAITTATTTTILSAPASGEQRGLKELHANAKGGANTITLEYYDGTNAYLLESFELGAGETLEYEDSFGFKVKTSKGEFKGVGVSTTDIQIFTSNGTWLKPSAARVVDLYIFPGAGGGGSGANNALAATSFGGSGGACGGTRVFLSVPASSFAQSEPVVVGAGGAGGAAQAAFIANGNIGTAGGNSSFGTDPLYEAIGGTPGNPGTVGGAAGNVNSTVGFFGIVQIPVVNGATTANNSTGFGGCNAGGGASVNAAGVAGAGGTGGRPGTGAVGTPAAGTGGVSPGGNGGNGVNTVAGNPSAGSGGGGGAGSGVGNAGNGGNGGLYNCGGGGGGGVQSAAGGVSSGAGGNGSQGIVVVITRV